MEVGCGSGAYTTCVAMTDTVFVLSLADGRYVKLLFTNYYDYQLTSQDDCDNSGKLNPPGSAVLRIRWAFVQ